ncbi:MAG: hypothetical protein JXO49_00635 [Deltaproteobacteria bacterium]|nr:hypothetical protein [Candidatus Anaeroferrophillus wilburensis]MBN2887831.1 hypothetical protein [Deltaproteobacteria bacterium]
MKSIESVSQMKKTLLVELSKLPEYNAFGSRNDFDRNRLCSWIAELCHIEEFGNPCDQDSDVDFWFRDECWTLLCDYSNDDGVDS